MAEGRDKNHDDMEFLDAWEAMNQEENRPLTRQEKKLMKKAEKQHEKLRMQAGKLEAKRRKREAKEAAKQAKIDAKNAKRRAEIEARDDAERKKREAKLEAEAARKRKAEAKRQSKIGRKTEADSAVPVKGGEVSDFDFAVGVVERAYAGYPDKTANRAAEYGALKERLRSGIASGCDTYDAVAEYLGWFDDSHLGTEGVRAYRPKSIRRPSDYAARMERYDPQFTHCRVDGETYLIRFPSCDLNEEQTAWVRTAVRAYLASGCENLILDIRGNGGGSDSAYEPLLRLLYDHEGAEDAMEYRVSDLAVAHVREFAGDTERGRGKIARMERTPAGEFLKIGRAHV